MRKLEGLVKEIQDEMDYLKRREMRFQNTNGRLRPFSHPFPPRTFHRYLRCGALTAKHESTMLMPLCVESTNIRVQNFALFTFVALVCLGTWQIFHLRNFFRKKYLID